MKSPIDLLPLAPPREQEFVNQPHFFYDNVAKQLIPDTVRIMNNGIPIDLQKVNELEVELNTIIKQVQKTIDTNKYIKQFLDYKYPHVKQQIETDIRAKMRTADYYYKDYRPPDMVHRSYIVDEYLNSLDPPDFDIIEPIDTLPGGVPKWKVIDLKPYFEKHPIIKDIAKKKIHSTDPLVRNALRRLAQDKADLWNRSYEEQIASLNYSNVMQQFNPASPDQKREFFEYLGIEPIAYSKDTGEASWGRESIEELYKVEVDSDLKSLYSAFIDFSFAAVVRNNFIKAFYDYTILHEDNVHRLHGTLTLLGAKTARYTSSNPKRVY